ncbi:hypothetical protein CPB84DRAFT_1744452 [Gymnopilus junonius]|uniref:Uncharacterized protein n=1 Tax=Gymnopilus junonius TaxID=109634 RepID=A0A9P5TR29_GYMJU|nr:hypothetical protein CPB84DRAFT_1744452 [Gymnopilus junonius]
MYSGSASAFSVKLKLILARETENMKRGGSQRNFTLSVEVITLLDKCTWEPERKEDNRTYLPRPVTIYLHFPSLSSNAGNSAQYSLNDVTAPLRAEEESCRDLDILQAMERARWVDEGYVTSAQAAGYYFSRVLDGDPGSDIIKFTLKVLELVYALERMYKSRWKAIIGLGINLKYLGSSQGRPLLKRWPIILPVNETSLQAFLYLGWALLSEFSILPSFVGNELARIVINGWILPSALIIWTPDLASHPESAWE